MPSLDVPYPFQVYGQHGRRVARAVRVSGSLRVAVEERALSEADGMLRIEEAGVGYDAPVFDGTLFLPVLLADGRPAGLEAVRRSLSLAAADRDAGFRDFLGRREPLLDHGDPHHRGDSARAAAPTRRGEVREILPSDEDGSRERCAERASWFRLVDGVPHTARFEPILEEDRDGWGWSMEDLVDDHSHVHWELRRLSGSGFARAVADASGIRVGGDPSAVRWRYDAERSMLRTVEMVLGRLRDVADAAIPVGRSTVVGAARRLSAIIELRDDLPPQDWPALVRAVAEGYRDRHPEPERIDQHMRALAAMGSGLELGREIDDAMTDDDLAALAAMTR